MEPRAHHILIGVFTLVVATCAILFSLWLSKAGNDTQTKNYVIVFTEAVRGLNRGSAVQFNGIRIGEVTKLSLDPQDIRRVLVDISIQSTIPIKQDTIARLALTGITGTSVIELQAGSPNSPLLVATEEGEPPVIYATPSPIASLMAGGEELMTNISELLINANGFFETGVADLEKLMQNLAASSKDLPELLAELKTASSEASGLLHETRQLIQKDGSQTFTKANQVLEQLSQTTQQVQALIEQNSGSIQQGAQGFAQLGPTMAELRQTLHNIKQITQELQNNPAQYFLGGENLQEYQP